MARLLPLYTPGLKAFLSAMHREAHRTRGWVLFVCLPARKRACVLAKSKRGPHQQLSRLGSAAQAVQFNGNIIFCFSQGSIDFQPVILRHLEERAACSRSRGLRRITDLQKLDQASLQSIVRATINNPGKSRLVRDSPSQNQVPPEWFFTLSWVPTIFIPIRFDGDFGV